MIFNHEYLLSSHDADQQLRVTRGSSGLFAPDAAEVGRAVLVAGRTGAGCGHPGPLPLPLQLRLWMRYKVGLGPPLQISKRYPANLLPLRCCQWQHQCASVPHRSL